MINEQEDVDQEEEHRILHMLNKYGDKNFYKRSHCKDKYLHVKNLQEYIESDGKADLLVKSCMMIPFKEHEELMLDYGTFEKRVQTCQLVPDPTERYTRINYYDDLDFKKLVGDYVLRYYTVNK